MRIPSKLCACLLIALGSWTTSVYAHFGVDLADTHKSRYGIGEIKVGPCGREDGTRGSNIYTYKPGETITLAWVEYVGHPGYYRIAFDDDGDDDFKDPVSIIPAGRSCNEGEAHCGTNDFYNNATVLIDDFARHDDSPHNKRYSLDVTLPDKECDNCTLQIIQVMSEASKAPYDPSATNADDLYYQCVDLVLKRD